MNERIKQLASQCWETTDRGVPIGKFTEFNKEKFAELIILECYQVCKNNLTPLTEYDSDEAFKYNDGVADCAILIKRHFGVE